MSKLFSDIRARVEENKLYSNTDSEAIQSRTDIPRLLEAMDVLHLKLASSKNFMYLGLLEMTAHMGIPEHKRKSMISEIESNYAHFVDEALTRIASLEASDE